MAVEEKKDDFKRHKQKCVRFKKPAEDLVNYGKYRSPFPPYVTVDELRFYRKRRPAFTWPNNNLKIEDGDFKSLKSEYTRRFKNYYEAINRSISKERDVLTLQPLKPEVSLKLEGLHDFQSEYNESFTKQSVESLIQPSNLSQIMDDGVSTSERVAEIPSQANILNNNIRARLFRRPTNLKIEGDFLHVTEYAEKFIQYLIEKRAELLRTPTTLKLEGDMETKTESRDQFVKYDKPERAHLCRKFSNLHLEGDHNNMTEKQEKYLPFEVHRRPPLTKKSTNLHLEGDLSLIPEYTRQYVEYKSLERPKLVVPVNHFRLDGLLDSNPDEIHPFHQKMHPLIPFLRESDKRLEDIPDHRRTSTRSLYLNENREKKNKHNNYFGFSKSASHPNLNYPNRTNIPLEGGMELSPEYKSSYVDFYKDGRVPPRVKPRLTSELDYMKDDSKMQVKPEYSSSYVNFPRKRPTIRKPESHLLSEGEVYHITEQNERFIPHTYTEKTGSCRRESELKLEGRFECQPEYRKAYIDYLIREKTPTDQRRRAFELVSNTTEGPDRNAKKNVSDGEQAVPTEDSDAYIGPNPEKCQTHLTVPTSNDSSSVSSVPSSLKNSAKPPSRPRKLSQMEESAFGPRCAQRKTRKSPSPLPPSGRTSKMRSRDVSPQLVPDLSKVPQGRSNLSCPTTKEVPSSERNLWTDSSKSDRAFFVIDEKVPSKRVAANNLYKEQKWMPSWDYSNQ